MGVTLSNPALLALLASRVEGAFFFPVRMSDSVQSVFALVEDARCWTP